jgi:hypothetical protein
VVSFGGTRDPNEGGGDNAHVQRGSRVLARSGVGQNGAEFPNTKAYLQMGARQRPPSGAPLTPSFPEPRSERGRPRRWGLKCSDLAPRVQQVRGEFRYAPERVLQHARQTKACVTRPEYGRLPHDVRIAIVLVGGLTHRRAQDGREGLTVHRELFRCGLREQHMIPVVHAHVN